MPFFTQLREKDYNQNTMPLSERKETKNQVGRKLTLFFMVGGLVVVAFFSGFALSAYRLKSRLTVFRDTAATSTPTWLSDISEVPAELKDNFDFNIFYDTWKYIKQDYVEKEVSESELFYGALEGMVAALDDPYSVFFEPDTSQKFQQEISGSFDGIGAEIGLRDNQLTIISPLPDSPSEKAGVQGGDLIIKIDDEETKDLSLSAAVNKIRGKKGTTVKLTLVREGWTESRDFNIIRDQIQIYSVEWKMLDNNIVHLKLKYFNEDTLDDFKKAMKEFLPQDPRGIILDIRNNPGGLLVTAIEISSFWTGGEKVVVIEKNRDDSFMGLKATNQNAILSGIPTVVLINQGSASGSEILAGALQDYKIARLIGETSFGKGSVQDLKNFEDGSSVKLTIAKWLTPLGREINEKGIDPDILVELSDEDWNANKDPQLDAARAALAP